MRSSLLLLIALFLFLFVGRLTHGNILPEGVGYAAISNNLAHGFGSFWALKFSETVKPVYFDHPPLMFGLQNLFFKALGDNDSTERIYNAVIILLTMLMMARIWIVGLRRTSIEEYWPIALMIWMLNVDVLSGYTGNLPDCTMTLLDLVAVFLLLLKWPLNGLTGSKLPGWLFLTGAASAVFAAFLTNGFAGLYPLLFFVIARSAYQWPASTVIKYTSGLILVFAGLLWILLLSEAPATAIKGWFNLQTWTTYAGFDINSRLTLLGFLLKTHAHWLIAGGLAWYVLVKRKQQTLAKSAWLPFTGLMGAAALLVIVIGPRQSLHHLIPALPWIALCLGIWYAQLLVFLPINLSASWLNIAATVLVVAVAGWIMFKNEKTDNGDITLTDAHEIMRIIPPGGVAACIDPDPDQTLQNYLQRYYFTALESSYHEHRYLIVPKSTTSADTLPLYFQLLQLPTKKFDLYRRR